MWDFPDFGESDTSDIPDFTSRPRRNRENLLANEALKYGVGPWNPLLDPFPGHNISERKRVEHDIPYSYGRHIDTALSQTKLLFYRDNPSYLDKSYPGLSQNLFREINNGFVDNIVLFPWMYNQILISARTQQYANDEISEKVVKLTREAIRLQLSTTQSRLPASSQCNLDKRFSLIERSAKFKYACHKKILCFDVHRMFSLGGDVHYGTFVLSNLQGWKVYRDLIILTNYPTGPLAVPYAMVLATLDKLEADYSKEIFLSCAEVSWDKMGCDFRGLTENVYRILENAYEKLGNTAIKLFKGLETLALGIALREGPVATCDHDFLMTSISDLADECTGFIRPAFEICGLFAAYIKQYGEVGIKHVLEQYGQEKMHYFPIVDPEGGLLKMYRIGVSRRPVRSDKVEEAHGLFVLTYIHQYRLAEGKLPPIYMSHMLDPRILSIYKTGDVPTLSECMKVPLYKWSRVRFRKHQEFNYVESELELLQDKGVAPRVSRANQCYHPDVLDACGQSPPAEKDPVRLVDDMLQRDSIDIKEYYAECRKLGAIPYEWRLIRLKAKERELKPVPRAFSVLYPNVRHMASVAEKNIADVILKYFTQQSMNLSGIELKGKIDDIIGKLNKSNQTWVAMILDLFQWNYTFREELEMPFARTLDEIFGVDHFSINQWIFRDAIFVSADPYDPPGYGNTFSGWTHHSGGNQGIKQKFWTLITLVVIKKVLLELNLDHLMQGAGDNQVMVFNTEGHARPKELVERVKSSLAQEFIHIGLKLKPEETWYSSELFNYHRAYYYKSSPVSIGLKQVTRAFAEGSEGSMGINNIISTAMNTGVAVAASSADPLIGPMVAYLEAYINLLGDTRWRSFASTPEPTLALLSCATTDGGFLPFIQLYGFYYSGHGDHLTDSYSIFRQLWTLEPGLRRYIAPFLKVKPGWFNRETALKIIVDPFSIPTAVTISPEAFIRDLIEKYLRESPRVKNKRLMKFLHHLNKKARTDLAWELTKLKELDLSLAHSILECTLVGECYQVLNRFTRLSTLAKTVEFDKRHKTKEASLDRQNGSWSNQIEFLSRMLLQNIKATLHPIIRECDNFFEGVLGVYYTQHPNDATPRQGEKFIISYTRFCLDHKIFKDCTYTLRLYHMALAAGYLPDKLDGPYSPAASEQIDYNGSYTREKLSESLVVLPMPQVTLDERAYHTVKGPLDVYRGSATKDSVPTLKLVNLVGRSEGEGVRHLLKLWGWMKTLGASDDVLEALSLILSSKVPGVAQELMDVQPSGGSGSYKHRFKTEIEDKGSYLSTQSAVSTYVKISSNYLLSFIEGSTDYMIFFQKLRNYVIFELAISLPPPTQFNVRIKKECCTLALEDPVFYLDSPISEHLLVYPIDFVISPEMERAMRREIEHQKSFDMTGFPVGIEPEDGVCAFVANQLGNQLFQHERGLSQSGDKVTGSSRFTTQYNTTLFKITDLKRLLLHIGVMMALRGFFGCRQRLEALKKTLQEVISHPVVPVDIAPYTKILLAIVESGNLYDLLALSPVSSAYLTSSIAKQVLRPFLGAIWKILVNHNFEQDSPLLLIEHKYDSHKLSYVTSFMKKNSSTFFEHLAKNHGLTERKVLEKIPMRENFVNIWITPDCDVSLSLARKNLPQRDRFIRYYMDPRELAIPSIGLFNPLVLNSSYTMNISKLETPETVTPALKNMHKVSKFGSLSPGAKYKLLEIISHSKVEVGSFTLFVCLADGGGSYSSLLLHCNTSAQLIFNTLLTPDQVADAAIGYCLPAALSCKHNVHTRVVEMTMSASKYGDLTLWETWEGLDREFFKLDSSKCMLTFDMEHSALEYTTVLPYLYHWIKQWKVHFIVIKLFSSVHQAHVDQLVELVGRHYHYKELIKPTFSSYVSDEFFLVCKGYSGPPVEFGSLDLNPLRNLLHNWKRRSDYTEAGVNIVRQLIWRRNISLCPRDTASHSNYGMARDNPVAQCLIDFIRPMMKVLKVTTVNRKGMDLTIHHMLIGKTGGAAQFWAQNNMILDIVMIILTRKHSPLWDIAEHSSPTDLQMAARDMLVDLEIILDRHQDPHILNKALPLYGKLITSTSKRLDPFVGALLNLIWNLSSAYDIVGKKMRLNGITSRDTLLSASLLLGRSAFAAPSIWANIGLYHIIQEGLDLFLTLKDVDCVDVCMENTMDADIIEALQMPGIPIEKSGTPVWIFSAGLKNFLDNCQDHHVGLLIEPNSLPAHPERVFTYLDSFSVSNSQDYLELRLYSCRKEDPKRTKKFPKSANL